MLVLNRQRDEVVVIGDADTVHVPLSAADREALRRVRDPALVGLARRLLEAQPGPIQTTIVDIRGDKVRLGFTAPRDVRVDRREVYEQRGRVSGAATGTP